MQVTCRRCSTVASYDATAPSHCDACGSQLFPTDYEPADTIDLTPRRPGSAEAAQPEGRVIGDYRLVRCLGRGGMGTAWEAVHQKTGRRVALKLLLPGLAYAPDAVERFLQEARTAAALSHPRSTFLYGAGEHAGQPFLAMELMPGRTLRDIVADEGPLPVARAVDYTLDVIEGLEAAHALGIVHRDVKPANCFLDGDGRAKIGDFGLARTLVRETALTQTGTFVGTPQFAAPEQTRGQAVDARTDQYAVGATLFFLLTARPVFTGDYAQTIAQIAAERAPRLRSVRPDVPQALDQIVARTLEKEPTRRYATLADLRQALLPLATGGTSIADVGRRFAAYMIDSMTLGLVSNAAAIMLAPLVLASGMGRSQSQIQAMTTGLACALSWLYYAWLEGRYGCAVGKLLMGLRVVNVHGERPGLVWAGVRSLIVPSALGLNLLPALAGPTADPIANPGALIGSLVLGLIPLAFVLLCLTTMRARNGYRGVHEWLSATRVIRLRRDQSGHEQAEVPVVAARVADELPRILGPFRVLGSLGHLAGARVLHARDDALCRNVWIELGKNSLSGSVDRRPNIARGARPRWLQGGEDTACPWNALEAVVGAPLPVVIQTGNCGWAKGRGVLHELALELAAAVADGTLPGRLSLDQIWIDQSGRAKLLEAPLAPSADDAGPATGDSAKGAQRATALLREAARRITRGERLPGHGWDFIQTLSQLPDSQETLRWAADELAASRDRPAMLRWDDRLGMLCGSLGLELSGFFSVTIALFAIVGLLVGVGPTPGVTALGFSYALAVPGIVGYCWRGGPVFSLVGIEVRRLDGQRASRWRCAWRNFLSWAPVTPMYATIIALLILGLAEQRETGQPARLADLGLLLAVCMLTGVLAGFLAFLAALCSLASPQRGIQDLLSGTYLAPR